MKKEQHEKKLNMKKAQHGQNIKSERNSEKLKECNTDKMKHEKSAK